MDEVGELDDQCSGSESDEEDQTILPQYVQGVVLHLDAMCDVCRVYPIAGTRYKSKDNYNYNLCQNCIQEHGSAAGNEAIRTGSIWHHRLFHGSTLGSDDSNDRDVVTMEAKI